MNTVRSCEEVEIIEPRAEMLRLPLLVRFGSWFCSLCFVAAGGFRRALFFGLDAKGECLGDRLGLYFWYASLGDWDFVIFVVAAWR